MIAMAFLMSPLLASAAGAFYLAADERTQDLGAFTNKAYWVDGENNPMSEWFNEAEYYVSSLTSPGGSTHDNRYLRTPAVQEAVEFAGGPLRLKGNHSSSKLGVLFLQTGGEGAKIPRGVFFSGEIAYHSGGIGNLRS
jgi:hypothetical protein